MDTRDPASKKDEDSHTVQPTSSHGWVGFSTVTAVCHHQSHLWSVLITQFLSDVFAFTFLFKDSFIGMGFLVQCVETLTVILYSGLCVLGWLLLILSPVDNCFYLGIFKMLSLSNFKYFHCTESVVYGSLDLFFLWFFNLPLLRVHMAVCGQLRPQDACEGQRVTFRSCSCRPPCRF